MANEIDETPGLYNMTPGSEEEVVIPKSAPRLIAARTSAVELVRQINSVTATDNGFDDDDDDAPITTGLDRLDSAVDEVAEVCEVIGRKSLELRRRMRRKRIDSAPALAEALISSHPPAKIAEG